jgi:uncharacterized protein involved in exopolysaccharide biosynthesis
VFDHFRLYPEVVQRFGRADAVEELKRHVEFKAPGGDTFSIAYVGDSPSETQQVTTALADVVIEGDAELRKTQAERAQEFLSTERASKSEELKEAEQRLATFMGEHRRFALDATPLAAGAAIRAASAGVTPTPTLRGAPVRAGAAPAQPARAGSSSASPAPSEPDDRGRALAALAAARANLSDVQRRFGEAHPDVRAAQGEVDRATARVAALGPAPAAPAPAPAPAAAPEPAPNPAPVARRAAPVVTPRAAPAPASSNGTDVVSLETEWVKLTRDVTAARQRVDQVEAALFKADVLANSERAGHAVQISVIDPAFLPQRPLGLAANVVMLLFGLAGLALGILGAVVAAALDDRIYVGADASTLTPILAEVPKLDWRRRSYATR